MLKECFISLLLCMMTCSANAVSLPYLTTMQRNSNQSPQLLCLSGRIVSGEISEDSSDNVKVTLKLSLDIKNVGSKPALIFNREPIIIEAKIIASPSDTAENEYLFLLQTLPSIARSPEWEELQKRLNKPSPPPDVIRELAPSETWTLETTDWFYINKKTNLDPNSKSWDAIRQASPVWLQVTLQMWSRDIEPNVDRDKLRFSKMLRRRWQQVGELQLESLISEPIPLDFSSFTLSDSAR